MKKYTQPINLKCYDVIKDFFKGELEKLNDKDYYSFVHYGNPEINSLIKNEMEQYGLDPYQSWLIFKRKNMCEFNYDDFDVHTDSVHVSLVIPIEGYTNAPMIWVEGDYDIVPKLNEENLKYAHIKWKGKPTAIHKEDIVRPTLCRVDIPHIARSDIYSNYRTVATVRFKVDLEFEEICAKFGY